MTPQPPEQAHETPLICVRARIAMADVDAARILYFAAAYRLHERAITDWFFEIGHPTGASFDAGLGSPVVASNALYSSPLSLDDQVNLQLRPVRIGQSSFMLQTDMMRADSDGPPAVRVWTTHVWSHFGAERGKLSARRLPPWLRSALEAVPPCAALAP